MASSKQGKTPLSQHAFAVQARNWQESNNYSFKEDPLLDSWIVLLLATAGAVVEEGR